MSVWACANRPALIGYKSIAPAEPGAVSKHSRKNTFALNSARKYDGADWHTVYSGVTSYISFLSGDADLGYVSLLSLIELVKIKLWPRLLFHFWLKLANASY